MALMVDIEVFGADGFASGAVSVGMRTLPMTDGNLNAMILFLRGMVSLDEPKALLEASEFHKALFYDVRKGIRALLAECEAMTLVPFAKRKKMAGAAMARFDVVLLKYSAEFADHFAPDIAGKIQTSLGKSAAKARANLVAVK